MFLTTVDHYGWTIPKYNGSSMVFLVGLGCWYNAVLQWSLCGYWLKAWWRLEIPACVIGSSGSDTPAMVVMTYAWRHRLLQSREAASFIRSGQVFFFPFPNALHKLPDSKISVKEEAQLCWGTARRSSHLTINTLHYTSLFIRTSDRMNRLWLDCDCDQSNYSSRSYFYYIPIEFVPTGNSAIWSADPHAESPSWIWWNRK